MATAWMIFGKNGHFATSPVLPRQFQSMIQNNVDNNHWVITNIYFFPDTSGYLIMGADGGISWYGNFPQDLSQATWALKQAGHVPVYLSWYKDGCWAVFCTDGAHTLGPQVPSQVSSKLQAYAQSNAAGTSRYGPANLIFAPNGEWLLIGSEARDEGDGTYDHSPNFPADVLAACQNLPTHTAAATVEFTADGSWVLIDGNGNLQWSRSAPADVYQAVQNFLWAGNTVTAIQFAAQAKVKGFADTHTHQFAHLGFGADGAMWGDTHGDISQVLAWCTPAHGPGGTGDMIGNILATIGYGTGGIGHLVGGYPEFNGWPRWNSITHETMFEDWLERAWQGGLRLMVVLAVNSEFLCGSVRKATGRSCGDMEAVDYQLQAAFDFQTYIDNKNGGPGKGWYRIVTSPEEARGVADAGKLAVVLGIEVDYLFGSYLPSTLTEQQVRDQIAKYFDRGVRHVFPLHFADNAFGGTAFQNALEYDPSKSGGVAAIQGIVLPYPVTTEDASQQPYGYQYRGGHMNVQGLTDLGKFLIKEMTTRGIMIDVDHTSFKSRSDLLDIAESLNYPVVSGHTGFVEINNSDKRHEGQLLPGEIERIRNLGGMVSVIAHQGNLDQVNTFVGAGTVVQHTCGNTSETLLQAYLYAVSKMQGGPVGIGTDFNGFAGLPGPRFGGQACPGGGKTQHTQQVGYPFVAISSGVQLGQSIVGRKSFDINVDGLAHVGMLPDLIAEFQALGLTDDDLSALIHSAEGYIQVWERAVASTKVTHAPGALPASA